MAAHAHAPTGGFHDNKRCGKGCILNESGSVKTVGFFLNDHLTTTHSETTEARKIAAIYGDDVAVTSQPRASSGKIE